MGLLQKIKYDQLSARKEKRTKAASLLTTLIGEASMVGKNDGNRESTDLEVINVIRKFIKNINETLSVMKPGSDSFNNLQEEKILLTAYLPKQLSENDLRFIVISYIDTFCDADIGTIMKFLKTTHDGKYDSKLAVKVVKEYLEKNK